MGNQMCCASAKNDIYEAPVTKTKKMNKSKAPQLTQLTEYDFETAQSTRTQKKTRFTNRFSAKADELPINEGNLVFKANVDMDIQNLCFSQRRQVGFRNRFEFDKKRILIANSTTIKLLGYSNESDVPYEVLSYEFNKGDQKIIFAAFLEDFDPKMAIMVTYSTFKNTSYTYLLCIKNKIPYSRQLSGASFGEEDIMKRVLIGEIKKNLHNQLSESNLQGVPFQHVSNNTIEDNFKITIKDGTQMDIVRRTIENGKINTTRRSTQISLSNKLERTTTQQMPVSQNETKKDFWKQSNRPQSGQMEELNYQVIVKKLKKIRNTELKIFRYKSCSVSGKYLFGVDQDNTLWMVTFKGIEMLTEKAIQCMGSKEFPIDEFVKLKQILINYDQDKLPLHDMNLPREQDLIQQVVIYGEFVLLSYKNKLMVDIFKKSGHFVERHYITSPQSGTKLTLKSLDHVQYARLEWSDRFFDIVQQSHKIIPKKLIITGTYIPNSIAIHDPYSTRSRSEHQPFLLLYDRINKQQNIIKAFKNSCRITSVNYGPYDNGHILLGMENGSLLVFGAIDLKRLFQIQVFEGAPLTHITFEPTQLVILGSTQSKEIATITFIKTNVQYVYVDLGRKKYCTVILSDFKRSKSSNNLGRTPKPKRRIGHDINTINALSNLKIE